jgi:hypothetical protein
VEGISDLLPAQVFKVEVPGEPVGQEVQLMPAVPIESKLFPLRRQRAAGGLEQRLHAADQVGSSGVIVGLGAVGHESRVGAIR